MSQGDLKKKSLMDIINDGNSQYQFFTCRLLNARQNNPAAQCGFTAGLWNVVLCKPQLAHLFFTLLSLQCWALLHAGDSLSRHSRHCCLLGFIHRSHVQPLDAEIYIQRKPSLSQRQT